MNIKKMISILIILTILSTTSVTFATEKTWNDITFEVPDGYSTGTAGVTKIGMMKGQESIILENYNEEKLNELKEESDIKDNKTYKIGQTDVTELVFEEDSGNVHFINFTKDDTAYDVIYKDIASEEDDDDDDSEDTSDETPDDEDNTDENTTDKEDADFNALDENNPVYIIINSIK